MKVLRFAKSVPSYFALPIKEPWVRLKPSSTAFMRLLLPRWPT